MKFNNYLLLVILFSFCLKANSQSDISPDLLYVHLNKPFYLTGEDIWYKVYFLNPGTESEIVHLEWTGPDGETLKKQALEVEENYAFGDLKIPLDWAEGLYTLRCYTLSLLNFNPALIFTHTVPIYNEFDTPDLEEEVVAISEIPGIQKEVANCPQNSLQLSLSTDKKVYQKRDSVIVIVKVLDEQGRAAKAQLSVSVTDANLIQSNSSRTICTQREYLAQTSKNLRERRLNLKPEKRVYASGFVYSPADKTAVTSRFLNVYFPESREMLRIESDAKGRYEFELPRFYGKQTLQFLNLNPYQNPEPIAYQDDWSDYLNKLPAPRPLRRSEEVSAYINLSKKRHKIEAVFDQARLKMIPQPIRKTPEYLPDKFYEMTDFEAMVDVVEFIDEVVLTARIKNKNKAPTIRLYGQDNNTWFSFAPWYMIDNYLTRVEDVTLRMPLTEIENIGIYTGKAALSKQFNPLFFKYGLVSITTNEKRPPNFILERENVQQLQGLYFPRPFRFPIRPSDRDPDFRPQVYWNPSLSTDENGTIRFSFPASDAIGIFRVHVEAMSEDGQIGIGQENFEVQFK